MNKAVNFKNRVANYTVVALIIHIAVASKIDMLCLSVTRKFRENDKVRE